MPAYSIKEKKKGGGKEGGGGDMSIHLHNSLSLSLLSGFFFEFFSLSFKSVRNRCMLLVRKASGDREGEGGETYLADIQYWGTHLVEC